ncbi:LysE family translocator [Neptunomonas phycophila]|uniref:LysE family translocator n=1 Tax=Neptunomonas TaxID=75687 RepID=UPI000948C3C0|nr:LysE family translocator [Neptunomonas phycophila]QLE98247.1 LysE family translocator [Neptunomonas phycophila]
MTELIAVMTITILAVISPGADFAMVTRSSYLFGRSAGLCSAVGISLGVQVHVMYTMLGVGVLITHSPWVFDILKYIGAIYLIYIGFKTISSLAIVEKNIIKGKDDFTRSNFIALKTGFLTNAFNPKTMLFVISVYTQFVSNETPLTTLVGYGLFMSISHLIWFSFIALFFSNYRLRSIMINGQTYVNKVIGGCLMVLGLSLVFVPLSHV